MELVDNKAVSRGLVRVQPGEDLIEALEKLAQVAGWREAFITGGGSFELVELASGEETITLENAEIVSLSGHMQRADGLARLSLRVGVMGNGRLHHGRVEAAVSGAMLLMIEAVTPEAPSRAALAPNALQSAPAQQQDAPSGARRPASPAASPAAAPSAPAAAAQAPAAGPLTSAAAASGGSRGGLVPPSQSFNSKPMIRRPANQRTTPDEHENPEVDIGDVLDHPQLGLCEVEDYDPSGGVRVRVTSGRLRVLRLDALHLLASEQDEQGRRVFKITGPRRRAR